MGAPEHYAGYDPRKDKKRFGASAHRVEVNTEQYQFSHGSKPRGFGSWAFGDSPGASGDSLYWVHQSTYGPAKKQAQAWAVARGRGTIWVMP